MRILEMRAREDFSSVLQQTLTSAWSALYQHPIDVKVENSDCTARYDKQGQQWYCHELLGGYFVDQPIAAVRSYLRDALRYTPRRSRMLPQWLLATAASSGPVLKRTRSPAFRASPQVPNASSILVVPGNQRIRLFDFERGVVRVVLKRGFSPTTMAQEIRVRRSHETEPWALPILAAASDSSWFEENIVASYALPRCPPWFPKQELERKALGALESWARSSTRQVHIQEYVEQQRHAIGQHILELVERFPNAGLGVALDEANGLARLAQQLGQIELTLSHGDFQTGNVLVTKSDRRIVLIDWEHSAERWKYYDRMVLGLGTRSPRGLDARWRLFLNGQSSGRSVLDELPISKTWRTGACALTALEDLLWYARESLSGPYFRPSHGLTLLLRELSKSSCLWSHS